MNKKVKVILNNRKMHILFFAIALHREKAIALLSIVSDIRKKRSYVKVGKWLLLEYINI